MSLRIATTSTEKQNKESGKGGKLFGQLPLISKLKQSFSAALKREEEVDITGLEYELTEIASYGFPGVAVTTSYDPVQKLLAIGTSVGKVLILGQDGLALRLRLTSDKKIKNVLFLSHLPLVIAIDEGNSVYLIDIANLTTNLIHKSMHNITCIEAFPDSKWLFIGTDLGQVYLLDIICGFQSPFAIDRVPSQINFLRMHPSNCQLLLAGCSQGTVGLINLKTGKVMSQFDINVALQLSPITRLTSLVWSPNSDVFAAGYDNGWVAFWELKNLTQPILIRTAAQNVLDTALEMAVPEQREPIRNLNWCQFSDTTETSLIISGGEGQDAEPHLTVVNFSSPSQLSEPSAEFCISVPFKVIKEMTLLPSVSPWFSGTLDPFAMLLVSDSGTISGFNLQGDILALPVLLQWLDCDFEQFKLLSDCPPALHNSLLAHENSVLELEKLPCLKLEGGVWQPKQVDNVFYDLALTSHKDGSIRFWDASSNTLSPLSHLTLYPYQNHSTPVQPLVLDFNPNMGFIIVGNSDCSVVIYNFCKEPQCSNHSSPCSSQRSACSSRTHNSAEDIPEEDTKSQTPKSSAATPESTRPDIHISTISLNSAEVNGAFPHFKILGHLGQLTSLKTHSKFLVVSDSEGGLSISNLKTKKVLFFERDIGTVPAKPTRRLTTQKNSKDKDKNETKIEYIVKLDVKEISDETLHVLGISSDSNAFLYVINRVEKEGRSQYVLSKGKIASALSSEESVSMVSFYDQARENRSNSVSLTKSQSEKINANKPDDPLNENKVDGDPDKSKADSSLEKRSKDSLDHKTKGSLDGIKTVTSHGDKSEDSSCMDAEMTASPRTMSPSSSIFKDGQPDSPVRKKSVALKTKSMTKTMTNSMAKLKEDKFKKSSSENDNGKRDKRISISQRSSSRMPVLFLDQESLSREEFYVTCFASKITIHRLCDQKLHREATLNPERGQIMKSKWIRREEHDILVCLTTSGFVDMYRLPCLRILYKSEVYMSKAYNSNQCTIANDGRIVVNINGHELRQLCFEKNHPAFSSPLNTKIQLFDSTRRCPDNSFKEVPWYALPFSSSQPDYIKKLFDKGRPVDMSPIDRTKSNHDTALKTYSSATHSHSNSSTSNRSGSQPLVSKDTSPNDSPKSGPSTPKSPDNKGKEQTGLAKMLAQTTDMLREREEKLNETGDKTAATADAAQGFLAEIKAFNERQAKKKWYQL